jgi:PAS domain S-box-containing protein
LLALVFPAVGARAEQAPSPFAVRQVLHLASYHQGYRWTDDIQAGLAETLRRSGQGEQVVLQVEYLDAKRVFDEPHQLNLVGLLRHKFAGRGPDLVIASDDDAFEFMKRFGGELFPGAPWVFCGVNNFDDARVAGLAGLTGVAEDVDFAGTLEAALRLFPQARRLAVVGDSSTAGEQNLQAFMRVWPAWEGRLELIQLRDLPWAELIDGLEALPADSLVLFLSFSSPGSSGAVQQASALQRATALLAQHAKVPFFTCWPFVMGHGILGGVMTDGLYQGRAAAEMGLRILAGERPEDIPIMRQSPNRLILDYAQLERFGLRPEHLPPGSEVINQPVDFFARHQEMVLLLVLGLVQMGVIVALLVNREQRRRAEDALRVSEEKHRLLLQESTDPIFSFSRDGTYLYVNNAFAAAFGKEPGQIIGRRVWDVFSPEEADKRFSAIREVFATGRTKVIEVKVPGAEGDRFFVTSIKPIVDDYGDVYTVLCISKDISERKRTEEALRESEERYRELFDGIGDLIYTQDLDGRFLTINRAATTILSYDPAELIGRCAAELMLPEHRRGFHEDYLPRLRERGFYDGVGIYLAKDGRRRYIEFRSNVVRGQGKEPVVNGVARDVTERKEAERALRLSEERYRSLFDSISDFIYTHDLEGRFLGVNRSACHSLGYEVGEVVGRPVADLMLPSHREGFYDEYLPGLIQQGEAAGVSCYLAKDGQVHYIEFRNRLVREPGKEPYVSGAGRDVTQRFRAERELRRLEEQLVQAQKMEAVGVLAGGVAHDFNNILQALSGYIQLLTRDGALEGSQREYLARMDQSVHRAAELVHSLLTFSRKAEKMTRLVDLNQEVEQVLRLLERTIPKMIGISAGLAPDLAKINADPTQMEQVIVNLASNARDAMPDGGKLRLSTANVVLGDSRAMLDLPPGPYVKLEVADSGQGMDRETMEHAFEPFFTTKEIGQGTGLGLATVYGIVKSHGGHISCASRLGQGSIFTIYLPAVEGREDDQGPQPQPLEDVAGGKEAVLLVDDDKAVLEVARTALADYGYQVLTADSGEACLEVMAAAQAPVDLVILDLGMPGMGGRRCLGELIRRHPGMKVLIASGYKDLEQISQTRQEGAADFIGKPYRLLDLLRKVRRLLDQDSPSRPA